MAPVSAGFAGGVSGTGVTSAVVAGELSAAGVGCTAAAVDGDIATAVDGRASSGVDTVSALFGTGAVTVGG